MHIVGVVEIAAGLAVPLVPRFGGLLVAAWLGAIIVGLLMVGGHGSASVWEEAAHVEEVRSAGRLRQPWR